jgi:hypothetical protein
VASEAVVTELAFVYEELARRCTPYEFANAYRTACLRGEGDLAPGEPSDRPIGALAAAVPRLISLAVATYAVHVLPDVDTPERAELDDDLLATIDATATGSLRRCHLALDADGRERGYTSEEWLPVIYTVADSALERASVADDAAVVHLAQDAARSVASAIDALDRDAPTVTDDLADALGRLLIVCMFADIAQHRSRAAQHEAVAAGRRRAPPATP